jgi:Flp pilus assembly pilin Flp
VEQAENAPMYGLHNLASLWSDESGISSVEFALLLAFVATGIIAAAESLANAMQNEVT